MKIAGDARAQLSSGERIRTKMKSNESDNVSGDNDAASPIRVQSRSIDRSIVDVVRRLRRVSRRIPSWRSRFYLQRNGTPELSLGARPFVAR